ncbi:hypothetical protein SA2016_0020 [Sinomonas atrocyanea]|uniref:Uncharacterized protein n=1 Tax=Sinomonas atrocyanea TaxID=37927 RepID=A0A126ZWB7_9MICC|nr:hypothetical protein [Sinomonas atrocyanea]AMM30725.1 hypothetical protein SA2016_0020 [Sinomonas atrocyanea]GEB63769.1 hypothetical protein SAT01_12170 [Sinomonas atrocyanea]GGG74467.1 hypothetical protein GCM10007172_29000 [Sinomonas atrocyanea]
MTVEERWDSLTPETRRWLLDNPGTIMLPRTLANAISDADGAPLVTDPHGEAALSPKDQQFIRRRANSARNRH